MRKVKPQRWDYLVSSQSEMTSNRYLILLFGLGGGYGGKVVTQASQVASDDITQLKSTWSGACAQLWTPWKANLSIFPLLFGFRGTDVNAKILIQKEKYCDFSYPLHRALPFLYHPYDRRYLYNDTEWVRRFLGEHRKDWGREWYPGHES